MLNRILQFTSLGLASALLIAAPTYSFADSNEDVQIGVSPEVSYILPGSSSNCLDWASLKMAQRDSSVQHPTLNQSVNGLRVSFPQFSLTWNKNFDLSISIMKLTIESDQIKGGKYIHVIFYDELEALIGGQTVADPLKVGHMISNDPSRDCDPATQKNVFTGSACIAQKASFNTNFAACGLEAGGIELANPKTKAFTAKATVELFGYTTGGGQPLNSVYASKTLTVKYAGF